VQELQELQIQAVAAAVVVLTILLEATAALVVLV
jgi:hypothetical protein